MQVRNVAIGPFDHAPLSHSRDLALPATAPWMHMSRDSRYSIWLVALLVLANPRSPANAQATPAPSVPQSTGEVVALDVARRLVESESKLAGLWPGFWGPGHFFAIGPVRGGALVVHPPDSAIGTDPRRFGVLLPTALRGRASLLPERALLSSIDLFFTVGERSMLAMRVFGTFAPARTDGGEVPWMRDSVASLVVAVVHEAFHVHQWTRFRPLSGQPGPLANLTPIQLHRAVLDSAWTHAALAAERAAIREALVLPTCEEAGASLLQYRERRESRLSRLPAAFRAYEDAHERAEGIPTWISYEALHQLTTRDPHGARASVVRDLDFPYLAAGGLPYQGPDAYSLYHLYVVGAAKAALLDRCAPNDWKVRVQDGDSLEKALDATRW